MVFFRDSGVDWSCDRQLEDRTCAVSKLCPLVLKRGTGRIPYSRRFLEVSLEKTYKSSGFSLAVFHYRKFHTVVTGQNRQVRKLSQIQLGKEKHIWNHHPGVILIQHKNTLFEHHLLHRWYWSISWLGGWDMLRYTHILKKHGGQSQSHYCKTIIIEKPYFADFHWFLSCYACHATVPDKTQKTHVCHNMLAMMI